MKNLFAPTIMDFDRLENPPSSKVAIELMSTVEIDEAQVGAEAHFSVCKEAFELGTEAHEAYSPF
ncbi:E3 ubiquitin-protein ligase [Sesbania bispinosa]|nr:E3 ubiquitin-protein ligase [Sesbania bispinosa]